jgi:hypothetical protein
VFGSYTDLPQLKAREEAYWELISRFHAAAFGPLAGDRVVSAAVRAWVDYWPRNALLAGGLTVDEAIDLVAGALIDLVRRRAGAGGGEGP